MRKLIFLFLICSSFSCISQEVKNTLFLSNFDTLKHDSFIYGGEEVTFNTDWDRIGVVFESNYSDYSTFASKYKLKADNQNQYDHHNFTVFQFTESLSIEERRKVIETIGKEKYVSSVGDLLYGNPNSAPTIIPEEIIVRWKRETTDSDRINKFIEEEGLEEIGKQQSLNITILKVQNPYNYRVLEVCNKLVDSGLVIFAEPNFDLQVIEGPSYNLQFKTANTDYYTRGNQKIAFQKKINFIGVAFKNEMSKASILKLIEDWGLTIDAVYMNGLFFVLKLPINLSSDSSKTIRESIILFKGVSTVGDILIQTENNLILATQDLIVKWKPETSEAVKQTFIKQYGLTEIRKISYIAGGFQYRIEPNVAYASTDICLNLLDADIVEFAEPVTVSTSEDD